MDAENPSALPAVAGSTVSRRPAAVVGIGIVLVLGGFLFQAQDLFFVAQVAPNASNTVSSVAAQSSAAALNTSSSISSDPYEFAASETVDPAPTQEYVEQIIPTNTNTYIPTVAQAQTHAVATAAMYYEQGKGKPPHQPTTGLPLWLLLGASASSMWLYARRTERSALLYK